MKILYVAKSDLFFFNSDLEKIIKKIAQIKNIFYICLLVISQIRTYTFGTSETFFQRATLVASMCMWDFSIDFNRDLVSYFLLHSSLTKMRIQKKYFHFASFRESIMSKAYYILNKFHIYFI